MSDPRVTLEPGGHTFEVGPGETILEAGLRHGLAMPYGCRNGACGSCRARVLRGAVAYPDGPPPGLSEAEAAEGYALPCQAVPEGDVVLELPQVGAAPDIPVRQMPVRVARMERVAPDVMRLWLKPPMTERLRFLPGQYLDVLLRDGRRRGFSIANPPHDDALIELHVRHHPGGAFTEHVFTTMRPKDLLRIEAPLGGFHLREAGERPILMVAGGTGFAPIKAMVEHALHVGLARPITVYWGARDRAGLYLHELAAGWARAHPERIRYVPVLSEPRPEDAWDGRTGLVHEAVLADHPDLPRFDVYMAGPPGMIRAAREAFLARGLPEGQLFYDSFEPAADPRLAAS